jgi:DNA-binding CsgD family transcriptional regulator
VAALRQLAVLWFPKPIHPKRLQAISDAVREALRRLEDEGTTLQDLVVSSLVLAIPPEPWRLDSLRLKREIARQLNNIVTEELLGPHWRRGTHPEDAHVAGHLHSEPLPNPLEALEATERAREAWRFCEQLRGSLNGKMRDLLDLLRDNPDATAKELAVELHIAPETVRVMKHRLKQRARQVRRRAAGM